MKLQRFLFTIAFVVLCCAGMLQAQTPDPLQVLWTGADQTATCHLYGDYITNVTFAGINNTTSTSTAGWHFDYGRGTTIVSPGKVVIGQTYPISVTTTGSDLSFQYVAVYVDWNQNHVNGTSGGTNILDANENPCVWYSFGTGSGTKTLTGTVTVPAGISTGNIYMRVMLDADAGGVNGGDFTCAVGYGEFEDYVLTVLAAAPTAQTSSILLPSNAAGTQLNISWMNGNGTSRAVFMKQGTGAITNPSNYATYTASANWSSKGTQLGSSGYYCIYNGTGNSVAVTNTTANTQYTIQVFEYTNTAGNEQYSTATATGNPSNATSLPVELTSFTVAANNSSAILSWKTATEVNNYGFEVERRIVENQDLSLPSPNRGGLGWGSIGFVAGNGTSNTEHTYSYSDANISSGTYAYRLKQIDNDGTFKCSSETEVTISIPKVLSLANYPNPFNPTTTINFTLAQDGYTTLKIYNVLGKEVATLVNGEMKAGITNAVSFNASKLSSGVYFSRLENNGSAQIKKLVLMK
jgi:Secretion system C-terminal sorting domain/GEVED domain